MKIKESKWFSPTIVLISSIIVTSVIDLLVYYFTKPIPKSEDDIPVYATEHDGNKIYTRLLSIAQEYVELDYPSSSVDELISIGYQNEKLLFTAIASDVESKIALLEMDTTSNQIDETLKLISNKEPFNISTFGISVKYYSYNDMNEDMKTSYQETCNPSPKGRFAYGRTLDANKTDIFFASYSKENTFYSITNATFDSSNKLDLTPSIRVSATTTNNSYLYWTLLKMCA